MLYFFLTFLFFLVSFLILACLCAFQILKRKVSLLEASNSELQRELQDRQVSFEHLTQQALDAQVLIYQLIFMFIGVRCLFVCLFICLFVFF